MYVHKKKEKIGSRAEPLGYSVSEKDKVDIKSQELCREEEKKEIKREIEKERECERHRKREITKNRKRRRT